jgi:hypothetical protein
MEKSVRFEPPRLVGGLINVMRDFPSILPLGKFEKASIILHPPCIPYQFTFHPKPGVDEANKQDTNSREYQAERKVQFRVFKVTLSSEDLYMYNRNPPTP